MLYILTTFISALDSGSSALVFELWPGISHHALGQDTLLLQCLTLLPHNYINTFMFKFFLILLFRISVDQQHYQEELKFMVDLDMTSFLLVRVDNCY